MTRPYDADATTPGVQPLDLTVVEPELAITKRAAPARPSLGDPVLYTIELSHTGQSGADAFDVVVVEYGAAGLTYVPGSAVPPATVSGRTLTWTVPALTQAQGRTVFTYRTTVDPGATVDVPIANVAQAAWTTSGGLNTDERTGADGPGRAERSDHQRLGYGDPERRRIHRCDQGR